MAQLLYDTDVNHLSVINNSNNFIFDPYQVLT